MSVPVSPSRTKAAEKLAPRAAMRTSDARASARPPPAAAPCGRGPGLGFPADGGKAGRGRGGSRAGRWPACQPAAGGLGEQRQSSHEAAPPPAQRPAYPPVLLR